MAFDILSIMNGATLAETGCTEEYQDIVLDYRDIVITQHNKYSMVEIQELATGILMTGGLQAPLVVGRVSGEYWLLSGHRRYSALRQLIQEGHREYEKIPCRYKDMDKLQFRMELLCGNTFNRKLSDYDLMMQAQEWKEILTEMKASGALVLNKGERIRDYVAQILGESSGKIGQLNAIYKSAPEEVKEKFQSGEMGITSAYEASRTVEPQPDEKSLEIQKKAEEKRVSESDTKGQREEICCENSSGEEPEEVAMSQPEEAAEPTDMELLREMLEKEKAGLDEMVKVDAVEELPQKLLRKKKILVAALAGMLCDLEIPESEEREQPELPVMKNNDQRKAWLRDYKSWGLWYVDEHIGARYYKYDFDNGARLIAEVYTQHNEFTGQDYESSYLHLVGGPEPEKHPTGAYGRWQRHETYSRYPDSGTELVEFLKVLQKEK